MSEYLKEHILEELDDAVGYMKKAVAHKGEYCSSIFKLMADDEIRHANGLLNMFNSNFKNDQSAEITKMKSDILDGYTEKMNEFTSLKNAYFSLY